MADNTRNLGAIACTTLGLVLPSLLSRVAIPGVDLDRWHEVMGFEQQLDTAMTLAALLMVPWVTAALLVHALAWLVPGWRRTRRSSRVAQGLSRASWLVGGLVLLAQVAGLALYYRHEQMVVNDSWAPWLSGASMMAASLGARGLAALISRRGLGDGMSVLIAGELLLGIAERMRQLVARSEWHGEGESRLTLPLALAGVLALTLWLSGWVTPRLRARWSVLPMITPSGLLPAGLAAALLAVFAVPGAGDEVQGSWLRALGVLFGLPLQSPLPADSQLGLGATALFGLLVAALLARPSQLDRILAAVHLGRAEGRSWYWVASFANVAWLLLLVRAAVLTDTHSSLAWLIVVAFVLHDVWMEWQLRTGGRVVPIARLNSVVAARAGTQQLQGAGIPNTLRGLGLRALFHGFAPFAELELLVGEADAARAAAELAPLLDADRSRG